MKPNEILLVEDNQGDIRLTQEAMKDALTKNRLHVVTNGTQALDFLHQRDPFVNSPRPDLILLDLNLPMKNGFEVLRTYSSRKCRKPYAFLVSLLEGQNGAGDAR